jgi:hypothetical protein
MTEGKYRAILRVNRATLDVTLPSLLCALAVTDGLGLRAESPN